MKKGPPKRCRGSRGPTPTVAQFVEAVDEEENLRLVDGQRRLQLVARHAVDVAVDAVVAARHEEHGLPARHVRARAAELLGHKKKQTVLHNLS